MPDLTSPKLPQTHAYAQDLAATEGRSGSKQSTAFNSSTPRPSQLQQSYVPPQQPNEAPPVDDGTVNQWNSVIEQRQAGFEIQPGGKMRKMSIPNSSSSQLPQPPQNPTVPAPAPQSVTMPPPNLLTTRPLPAVLQSSALQQTLAPERAPSFGQPFDQSTPPVPSSGSTRQGSKLGLNVLTSMARPGNKRLPSQTLVPDGAKRRESVSEDWDGEFGQSLLGLGVDEGYTFGSNKVPDPAATFQMPNFPVPGTPMGIGDYSTSTTMNMSASSLNQLSSHSYNPTPAQMDLPVASADLAQGMSGMPAGA